METNEININDLPDELLIYIFKFLPLESLLVCEEVCQYWEIIARDPAVWRNVKIVYSGKPHHREMSAKSVEVLNTHNYCVQSVKVQYVDNYPLIISILKPCANITSLELVMCKLHEELKTDLQLWPNLQRLNLKNSVLKAENEFLLNVNFHNNLKSLSLAYFGLSRVNLDSLYKCMNLRHIFIEKITSLTTDDIITLITVKQMILESLHIYGSHSVNDKCLNLLQRCHLLKDLAIIRCENLTDKGLSSIMDFKEIRYLQLWNNEYFSESVLFNVFQSPNLYNLVKLSLSRIKNISSVMVDIIAKNYTNLKFLAFYQCPKICEKEQEEAVKAKFPNAQVILR